MGISNFFGILLGISAKPTVKTGCEDFAIAALNGSQSLFLEKYGL
jgi:hypothetical protein